MANNLDFNRYRPPVLPVTLRDKKGTKLSVSLPSVELLDEFRANSDRLAQLVQHESEEMVDALYDLAAKLLSNNRNLKKITPDQLRTVYGMEEEDLVVLFYEYTAFINGVENAKN